MSTSTCWESAGWDGGEPLYEFESKGDNNGEATTALRQFVLHASLDSLHSILWSNSSTFLRVIDRFNSHLVSSYVTPGGTTMLLLHNGKSEDVVRQFFIEAHEVYVKNMMNPFTVFDTPISSPHFDASIKALAKRVLGV